MKAFVFLVALIAGTFASFQASAAAIQHSFNLGTISSGSILAANTEDRPAGNELTAFDYFASGTLAAKTAITFTFTANKVLDSYYDFETGTYNGFNASLTLASPNSTASLAPALMPVMLSAAFTRPIEGSISGNLDGTITIKNLTNSVQAFGARFTSFLTQSGCEPINFIKVNALVSSVPLPPALLMFGSGIVGLAGFAGSRKRKA